MYVNQSGDEILKFNDNVEIHLDKARSMDFYKLVNNKTHTGNHPGPTRWSKKLSLNQDAWSNIFKSLKTVCKENKLREYKLHSFIIFVVQIPFQVHT